LFEPGDVADGMVQLEGARAAHLIDVLRVAAGRQLRVGILDGPFGVATVSAVDGRTVALCCRFGTAVPARPGVDLLLAVPRPKVLQRLWAQLAALGVGRIILTNAYRVERSYFDTHVLTPVCYRPLLIEGLQQARDTRIPIVTIHRRFKVLIEDELDALSSGGMRLVADPGAPLRVAAQALAAGNERVLVAVGPEGGWTTYEQALLEAHGFLPIGLGPRTLRVDTACVALLGVVHAQHARTQSEEGVPV
jgi:RsmE family RNA methyltransferase